MNKHLFLKILNWEEVERPAVWCMRQAGRYLPWYNIIKNKYDFWTRVKTPELASIISLEPIKTFWMDACILFSDILVLALEMWIDIDFIEDKGPILKKTIRTKSDIQSLDMNAAKKLFYVYDAIKKIKLDLKWEVPLIWFAWAPFTILCYIIESSWSKDFVNTRKFCFSNPKLAIYLLEKITDLTIEYLKKQIEAWVDAVQVFDTWASLLWEQDFEIFILPFISKIVKEISPLAPIILFEKWANHSLDKLSKIWASALWLDWSISPKQARKLTWWKIILQWNFDPAYLFLEKEEIKIRTHKMIEEFWVQKYIANLWHWIFKNTNIEWVKAFVDAVKYYKK